MKKTFIQTIFLFALGTIFIDGEINFSIVASPRKAISTKSDSKSRLTGFKKLKKSKGTFPEIISPTQILFEENKGQTSQNIKFLSRGKSFSFFLTQNEAVFQLPDPECDRGKAKIEGQILESCKALSLTMKMAGANATAFIRGIDPAVTKSGYFIGNDQSLWLDDIDNFQTIEYQKIYQGIDLLFHGLAGKLEYDFRLTPHADASLIQLHFDGMKKVKIDRRNGDLIFKFSNFELRHKKPSAYQIVDGKKRKVKVRYVLRGKNRVGFELGEYDRERELIIDPVIYSTYLGGSRQDSTKDVAVDASGNIYLASFVNSGNFLNPDLPGNTIDLRDVVVTKLNPDGTQIIYNIFIGGSKFDDPYAIDVDSLGNAYVGGYTNSPNFPLLNARQTNNSSSIGGSDGFITKLNSTGSPVYSTYHGSVTDKNDFIEDLNVDSAGNAYVVGKTRGNDFPILHGYQTTLNGVSDAFLSKLGPSGVLLYSTYFGGAFDEDAGDVDVDDQGNAFITGFASNVIPLRNPCYSGSGRGFAARFDTNVSGNASLIYSSKLVDGGWAIAVGSGGNAYVIGIGSGQSTGVKLASSGNCLSWDFPVTNGFVDDIAVDTAGNSYYIVRVETTSDTFGDGFLIRKSLANGTVADSVVLNGSQRDTPVRITYNGGFVYVAGYTSSLDFPTTPDALQRQSRSSIPGSSQQGFLAKVQFSPSPEREPLIFIPGIGGSTLYEADANDNPIENLWADGLTQVLPFPTQKLRKLSLNPDDAPFPRIVAVNALRYVPLTDIYGSFLEDLATDGNYKEMVGCSVTYSGEKPTMFVFPYDWRLSNINSAEKLSDLVDCIRQIHPGKRINILTHSMGGLVARRYIINHPTDHNIDKLVTMVAPWLGAPKAVSALFTGKFLGPPFDYVYSGQIKNIVRFGEAPHQLLPSAWYFINGGRPLAYRNSTNINYKEYSYSQTYDFINEQFPIEPPYRNSAIFHQDEPRQDNWTNDVSGIKNYHLYGQIKCDDTIGKVLIHPTILYPLPADAGRRFSIDTTTTQGDETVPVLSANRPSTLLAPNTVVRPYVSQSCRQDNNYKHNGILQNEQFKSDILGILNSDSEDQLFAEKGNATHVNNESQNFNSDDLMNYLQVTGVDRLEITDESGNTNSLLGAMDTPIPEIDYEYGSSVGEFLVFPHEVKFSAGKIVDIKFRVSTDKIVIENIKGFGRENATEVTKFLDLQLPVGAIVWLEFMANGLESLRYDSDGDGAFETEVQPTFHLTGTSANDITPPNIDISFSVNNNTAVVTVNAIDNETGINQIRYIINGETSDYIYDAPFTINLTQSKLLYVSAENNAGNRNLLAKWLDVSSPTTTATQTPAPNANGWGKENVSIEIKSLDDLGGSGIESLTFSGSGAQIIPEETHSNKEIPFTFPQPSAASDFLAKSLAVNMEGITNLNFFAKDNAGNVETTKTVAVKIDKTAPETNGSYTQNGNQMTITLASNDVLSGIEHIYFSVDGGNLQTYTAPFAVSGTGDHSVAFFATDKAGNVEQTKILSFTIVIVNPSVIITSPSSGAIYPVGAAVSFAGNFGGDNCNSHTAVWTFDSISQSAVVNESNYTVTANHAFSSAGIYLVTLTVNNNCGGTGTANTIDDLIAMVVVYDPGGGFVTGGGWIDSPFGAYTANPTLTGRASFGFNSKYQRGANMPTGNTEFQFRVADFNFKSTSYDWLVVSGAKVQFKGSGSVNNMGNFGFMLSAIDGQINGGGGTDKFRLKIWDKVNGNVIYDNQLGGGDNDHPRTEIGGGSIIIHR